MDLNNKIYHVIVRGNDKKSIFENEGNKKKYIYLIKKYKKKYDFDLLAYVIMDNHAHLLIEEKEVYVSKVMQSIQISYSKYYNEKYNKTGHVFEKRYKKVVCKSRENFLQVIKYIHRNPMEIGFKLNDYPWSSHQEYINNINGIVDKELLYKELSTTDNLYVEKYKEIMMY